MTIKDVLGEVGKTVWSWLPQFKKGGKIQRYHMGGNTQAYTDVIKAKSGCKVSRAKPRKIQKKKTKK
jgi:hypothetical protein